MYKRTENNSHSLNCNAFLCSVGDYSRTSNESLLDSYKIDKDLIINSLNSGLKLNRNNIFDCSDNAIVTSQDFFNKCKQLPESEICIFYFSGHGGIIDSEYNFCFSDTYCCFHKILTSIKLVKSVTKIIFLDTCHAGTDIIQNYFDSIDYNFEGPNNEQFVFFASSKISENSMALPNGSIFTKCLSNALDDNLNKYKNHTMFKIIFLTFLYLRINDKKNKQHCMLRTNIIGDIFFHKFTPKKTLSMNDKSKNADDLQIEKLFKIEEKLVYLYDMAKKLYIKYFSYESSEDELKNSLSKLSKLVSKIVYSDLQKYLCNRFNDYQECLDNFGQTLYDFLNSFIGHDFDETYQHYKTKDCFVIMAEDIEALKSFRENLMHNKR